MKSWIIDLGSFTVEAETEEEAERKAVEMISQGNAWVRIDMIIPEDTEVVRG